MEPAALNRMLEGRAKDLAALKRGVSKEDVEARRIALTKCLGLEPLPARTDLKWAVTGTVQCDGYRIDKIRYESRPGYLTTAHLYVPEGTGPFPLIASGHGDWQSKKAAPVVQVRGIANALHGFATLIVDAPGKGEVDTKLDERALMGDPKDPALAMGCSWIGVYTWDLIRGIDGALTCKEIDQDKVAATGEGKGGIAAAFAFVLDPRIAAAALVCSAPSFEQGSLDSFAKLSLPGLALAGDFADILALRPETPVALLAAKGDDQFDSANVLRTADKLKRTNKNVRFELFEGGHDYNRRMRESVAAFLAEHLRGESPRAYLPEPRPLTDGAQNPYPSGTLPENDPSLTATAWEERHTLTLRDLLKQNMAEPYPSPMRPSDRLAPWLKFSTISRVESAKTLGLHDLPAVVVPRATPSIGLPYEALDSKLAVLCGLSLPEFCAQLLHLVLPGRPETWEKHALAGEGFATMIASVKTLFEASNPETEPTKIVAEGPFASLTAMFLRVYRPTLEIDTSHTWTGWMDLLNTGIPELIQPQARYLAWPF